jgi:large subunit ribosomal protein L24
MNRIKKGDTVFILSGKDKGMKEKVISVFPKEDKIVVQRVKVAKKHQRPTRNFAGGIVERAMPFPSSNAMVVCPNCNVPARIAIKTIAEGKRIRTCKRCEQAIDKV